MIMEVREGVVSRTTGAGEARSGVERNGVTG